MADNSSSLSLLTVLKPGGSSHIGAESKPAKTIDQMIALMSERGLVITDEAELRQVLFDCNYYRLSGYFRSFQVNPAAGDNRPIGTFVVLITVARPCGSRRVGLSFLSRGK